MSSRSLKQLFNPTSVAVVGASNVEAEPGSVVMANLLSSRFLGPVMPIHPDKEPIHGQESYSDVDTLPLTPDLALICAPPDQVPEYVTHFGRRGTRAVVILSRGVFRYNPELKREHNKALQQAAQEYSMRILGPNCLGFINPNVGINASLAHRDAMPGKLAFVSQSDSLFTTVLDWATSKSIGFSHFISLGDRFDIHFGNILDYLNMDPKTRAILLYIETITNARSFMSAARATARNKPVLVIKAGRSPSGAEAAAAHSGAYLGADDVYDAAFRRAGMLRVFDVDELIDAVETLARTRPVKGDRLAVLTNGGGPGFLAVDALIAGNGQLAELDEDTLTALGSALGSEWSYSNPLIIRSSANEELYAEALRILLRAKGVDAVLVMHVPAAGVSSVGLAHAVINTAKSFKRNVLTSWLGMDDAEEARMFFSDAGIPTYDAPEHAVNAFLNMVEFRRNQEILRETPPSLPEEFDPEPMAAKEIIHQALAEQRQILNESEAAAILKAYDIPMVSTRSAETIDAAVQAAEDIGYPVALKILSPQIQRRSQVGGLAVHLENPESVRRAANAMDKRVKQLLPNAEILGFSIQQMTSRASAFDLFIEVGNDPVFGPTIRFGHGGPRTEVVDDTAVTLPPLNLSLANKLMQSTQVYKQLKGYMDLPPADIDAVSLTLVKISQLIIDLPEVFELEINPLLANEDGVMALDVQIRVAQAKFSGPEQLAIRPYPQELEECAQLRNGQHILLRPIRPEDEPDHWDFIDSMSVEDKRFRFFGNIGELPKSEMTRFTQIDYDREMAFIARGEDQDGIERTLGVVRAATLPDNSMAEFAIALRSDIKRQGLGRILMDKIIRYCDDRKTNRIVGQALADNAGMVGLARAMGFDVKIDHEDDVYDFSLVLHPTE